MCNLVSVIMPSYNTAKYICDSIASVVTQTYTDWELIIVDDASTDDTEDVVQRYVRSCVSRENALKIRFIKNDHNSGAAISRNRALEMAKGKWVAFLDSDDLWAPDKLEKQIEFMRENDYAFSYTLYTEIDENGNHLGVTVGGPKRITRRGMFDYCWPGCLTVMYNREFVGNVRIADVKKNNDYAIWLKICKKTDCFLLPETLANYRKRSGSISSHNYFSLIKWHYELFRVAECLNPLVSLFYTARNLFFGAWKKLWYVKIAR